ncbi:MAG: hypothetical protein E7465_02220 [Ruminococcaceae bacterium]|nr:hypothetical protein [Oscillospiraceae bacterium]
MFSRTDTAPAEAAGAWVSVSGAVVSGATVVSGTTVVSMGAVVSGALVSVGLPLPQAARLSIITPARARETIFFIVFSPLIV